MLLSLEIVMLLDVVICFFTYDRSRDNIRGECMKPMIWVAAI